MDWTGSWEAWKAWKLFGDRPAAVSSRGPDWAKAQLFTSNLLAYFNLSLANSLFGIRTVPPLTMASSRCVNAHSEIHDFLTLSIQHIPVVFVLPSLQFRVLP